jgi:Uma2 family endonuclease
MAARTLAEACRGEKDGDAAARSGVLGSGPEEIAMSNVAFTMPRLSLAEFIEFAEASPDEEKWELIDGVPIMQASPIWRHQAIVRNVMFELMIASEDGRADWEALPGLGTKVGEPNNLPVPDIIVRPRREMEGWIAADALMVVEVLSPDTRSRDLKRKPALYASAPSLRHYLIVDSKKPSVILHDRAADHAFVKTETKDMDGAVELAALGLALPLARIYRGLSFGS